MKEGRSASASRRPRVVMIAGQFFPVVAGSENQARRLAGELLRRGTPVEIWTRRLEAAWPAVEVIDGVTVRRLGWASRSPLRLRRLERWQFMAALLFRLVRERDRYELIHVNQVFYPAVVAALAGALVGRPCVARLAGTAMSSDLACLQAQGLGLSAWLVRRLLTRIVAPSEAAEAECRRFGYQPERVVRIPNGVPLPEDGDAAGFAGAARFTAGRLEAVYVGTLRRVKRVDLVLESWRLAAVPGRLRIVGDGPERGTLEALAAPCGGTVELLGFVEDPGPILRSADTFVLASDGEGMSNALLEAMAAGCAGIATWVGGNVEALRSEDSRCPGPGEVTIGDCGLLVPRGDAVALAAALRHLCEAPGLHRHLGGTAARRCRERFSFDTVTSAYSELYDRLARSSS